MKRPFRFVVSSIAHSEDLRRQISFSCFFSRILQKKLRSDKKHKIKKFRYGATNIFVVFFFFFCKLFLKRLLSRNTQKCLLELSKLAKTYHS